MFIRVTKALLISFCISISPVSNSYARNVNTATPPADLHSSNQVLVTFHPGTAGAVKSRAHDDASARLEKVISGIEVHVVKVPEGTVEEKIAIYQRNPNVKYAEPNYLRPLVLPTAIPNEGVDAGSVGDIFQEQWSLNNTGQKFYYDYDPLTYLPIYGVLEGTPGADISAVEGWDLSTGDAMVKIGILDTGIDCNHPDLDCNEEISFIDGAGPQDDIGHGTHVAGLAAATGNNNIGIAGVAWTSWLGNLKVCYPDPIYGGICDTTASAEAIMYAANNGYHVINMSYAGAVGSSAERDALAYAWSKGVVAVAAASNDYMPTRMYPAAFAEVIAVAATDHHDNLAYFSNFGSDWVSVAAPGMNMFSAYPASACYGIADCYTWLSGTSMASPIVAGVAAVVWAHQGYSATTNTEVRNAIEQSADGSGVYGQNYLAWTTHGRVNLASALNYSATPPPPPPPATISAVSLTGHSEMNGRKWNAMVDATVSDTSDSSVLPGAVVLGEWHEGTKITQDSCTANSNGECQLSLTGIRSSLVNVEFVVNDIVMDGYSYLDNDNTIVSRP